MEIFISILAGLLISGIAWFCTRYKLRTDVIVVLVALLLGAGYTTFQTVIPPASQEWVVNFVSKAMTTSWLVWQFLIKPIVNPQKAV